MTKLYLHGNCESLLLDLIVQANIAARRAGPNVRTMLAPLILWYPGDV